MQQVWGFFQFQLQTRGNSGSTEAAGAEAALLGWEDGERKATPAEETGWHQAQWFAPHSPSSCTHTLLVTIRGNEKQPILNSTIWWRMTHKSCQQNWKVLMFSCILHSEMKVMRKQVQVSKEPCEKWERENPRHIQKHPCAQRLPLARGWAWTPQHTAGGMA